MKKIFLINEGRLINNEMSYLMGGVTSCPNAYSDGTIYCGFEYEDKLCFEFTSCSNTYYNCSITNYSSCEIIYDSAKDCLGYGY